MNETVADKFSAEIAAEDLLSDLRDMRRYLNTAHTLMQLNRKVPRAVMERCKALLDDVNQMLAQANDDVIRTRK